MLIKENFRPGSNRVTWSMYLNEVKKNTDEKVTLTFEFTCYNPQTCTIEHKFPLATLSLGTRRNISLESIANSKIEFQMSKIFFTALI